MTVNTMKTLMLAAVTAVSLGASAAMAQEGGSTYPVTPDYWAPKAAGAGQIQSGSSDAAPVNPASQIPNWRDLPTYGGQG
jgi:hypothetical protein